MKKNKIMNKYLIYIAVFATSIILASCGGNSTEGHDEHGHGEEGHEEEGHDEHENSNTATLTNEQIESIGIKYGSIEKKQLTSSLKLNGLLRVPNNNQASVTSLYGGVINTLPIQQGNMVKKGQVIATLSNPNFIIMQEDFLTISSKLSFAEIEYKRQTELNEGNATSLKKAARIRNRIEHAQSTKSKSKKQLELLGVNPDKLTSDNFQSVISVRSPINGIISNIHVNIGSYVDANKPIADIVDNSQLHLDLYVYEKDLAKLQVGQTIHFTLTNNPGQEYDAEVYAVSNTFEPNTKTIAVHAKVEGDKQGLIDGMNITALVSLDDATVDAVPTDAIVSHEGQDYIFIVTDEHSEEEHHDDAEEGEEHEHDEHGYEHNEAITDEHSEGGVVFEKIPVKKGTTDVGYSEITLLKDIPAGSKIVIEGAFFILGKMNNKGEGHSH
ncbi:MAG: efflux RND transporter periplasmic adaptor subunit [Crocinitomicaceae bacterium]|nr:efflux RND transporter periplasmic adaptor subunit [Crocinitomicaceae bacterium]